MERDLARSNPTAQGSGHGPARPDQLGRRRQGLLRADARADRARRAVHRRARPGRPDLRRPEVPGAAGRARATSCWASCCRGCAAWPAHSASSAPCRPTSACCGSSTAIDAPRLAELGTSCPDHFLRTKIKPLYVDWDPQAGDFDALVAKLDAGLEAYRAGLRGVLRGLSPAADSPPMRDPNPTVILIPGLGMIAWGKDKSESRVTAEFYNCAVEVMRGAEAISEYIALPRQEAFDIEYWLLEEAKLQAHAAREGAGAAGRRGDRRRQRDRQNHGPPRCRAKARTWCAPIWTSRQPKRRRPSSPGATASASAWPARASPAAARRSGRRRHHQPRQRARAAATRSCWPTAGSTTSSSRPASLCRPTATGASRTTAGPRRLRST